MDSSLQLAITAENLYVTGIPPEVTDEQLTAIFMQYGYVRYCKRLDPLPSATLHAALLCMSTVDEATWLIQNVHGNIPNGLALPVSMEFLSKAAEPTTPHHGIVSPEMHSALGAMIASASAGPQAASLAATAASTPAAVMATFAADAAAAPSLESATSAIGGSLPTGQQMTGTVKRWDTQKGFGFIVPTGGGPDVFVHARELTDGEALVNGTTVTFEAMLDEAKGPGRYRAKICTGAVKKDEVFNMATTTDVSDNLFMAGLPLDSSEEVIRAIFSQYGQVASVKKLPTQNGKTDCAALVRMADVDQAKWLMDNVNRNIPNGLTTPVTIRYAENKGRTVGKGAMPPVQPQYGKLSEFPAISNGQPY